MVHNSVKNCKKPGAKDDVICLVFTTARGQSLTKAFGVNGFSFNIKESYILQKLTCSELLSKNSHWTNANLTTHWLLKMNIFAA